MSFLPRSAFLPVFLSLSASVSGASAAHADVFTYARATGPRYELRTFDEQTGQTAVVLQDVEFLAIELAGEVRKDRLRRGLVRREAVGGLEARITLPSGDLLYRISRAAATELLLVPTSGNPTVLLSVPDLAGSAGLASHVHVAPDASWVAASTAGGDVLVAEIGGTFDVFQPTAELSPLAIDPTSLRVSSRALWFVASGRLYRSGMNAGSAASTVALGGADPVDPELVLAGEGGAVVVAAVEQSGDMKRRLFLVRDTGPCERVSASDPEEISPAGLLHALGPFLAVAPDAGVVAWRQLDGSDHEVFIRYTGQSGDPIELTDNHTFANYIDSIGVFAFGGPRTLCFFAGDRHRGQFEHDVRVGASDMYAVQLGDPMAPESVNITRTSQQAAPPFVLTGNLDFIASTVGPHTRRIHLDLSLEPDVFGAGSFEIQGGHPGRTNFVMSPEQLSSPARRFATQAGVLLHESLRESVPLFAMDPNDVECDGDPALEPLVRILVHNKEQPLDPDAKVFFDGQVALGEPFEAHAASAGESHLPGDVKVHVLALDDTPLQFVKLKSDCGEPLREGDRFGAVRLLDSEGEDEPLNGEIDHCLTGSMPVAVTLRFHGGGCSATQHHQDPSKVRCSGSVNTGQVAPVRVVASDKEDPHESSAKVWFDGPVSLGESCELLASAAGEARLKNDTWVHVLDAGGGLVHSIKFHTSCSQPLVNGDRFGAFELTGCTLEEPAIPGDLCAYGRPRALTFAYEGLGCLPVELGQRLRLDPNGTPDASAGESGPRHAVAPRLSLGGSSQGNRAAFTFPLGTDIECVTPSRERPTVGFVTTKAPGIGTVCRLDCWSGAMTIVIENAAIGPCLGFSPSGGLLVPRQVTGGFVLELYSPSGAVRSVDSGPGWILPLRR